MPGTELNHRPCHEGAKKRPDGRLKHKRLRRRRRASAHWLGRIARRNPTLFVLWETEVLPEAGS